MVDHGQTGYKTWCSKVIQLTNTVNSTTGGKHFLKWKGCQWGVPPNLEGNFSLSVLKTNSNGLDLEKVPDNYCNQTVWFDSEDSTFEPKFNTTLKNTGKLAEYHQVLQCTLTDSYCSHTGETSTHCTTGMWNSIVSPLGQRPMQLLGWTPGLALVTLFNCATKRRIFLCYLYQNVYGSYNVPCWEKCAVFT